MPNKRGVAMGGGWGWDGRGGSRIFGKIAHFQSKNEKELHCILQ